MLEASAFLTVWSMWCEQVYKPDSVLDSHLSRHTVAGMLKPPPENGRASLANECCPPTVLLRIEFTAAFCLQTPGELLPHLSTLTAQCAAVYLCCTGPEVAFGGRYPLSLPCGARTFLTDDLSVCPRGCPAYSPQYCTTVLTSCQIEKTVCVKQNFIKARER
jgi:hypothetical protein